MANTPLIILTGNLKIGASSGTAVDVADAVAAFRIRGMRDVVEIPATFATGTKGKAAGAAQYEIELDYMPDDTAATTLFAMLWDALDPSSNPTGELYFEGTFHGEGAVSADNPKWSGTFVATEAELGGASNELSRTSASFPLTGRPTKVTT